MEYKRMLFSLPLPVIDQLQKYADLTEDGNKSGFVAEAIVERIKQLKKKRHQAKLRQAYQNVVQDSLDVTGKWKEQKEWEKLDNQLWQQLDED